MCNERVSLHLSEPDATCPFPSLSVVDNGNKVNFQLAGSAGELQAKARTLTGCRVNGSIGPVVLT